jgi:hypothetical protein
MTLTTRANMVGVNAATQSEDGRTPLHLALLRMSLQLILDNMPLN